MTLLVEPLEALLPLGDQPRLERALPVPRDGDLNLPALAHQRLGARAIAAVAPVLGRDSAARVAQMMRQLRPQRPLHHRLGQRRQQALLA